MLLASIELTHALPCLAFAVELAGEKRSIIQCAPLFDAPFAEKRRLLTTLPVDAGYEAPGVFRSPEEEEPFSDAGRTLRGNSKRDEPPVSNEDQARTDEADDARLRARFENLRRYL